MTFLQFLDAHFIGLCILLVLLVWLCLPFIGEKY